MKAWVEKVEGRCKNSKPYDAHGQVLVWTKDLDSFAEEDWLCVDCLLKSKINE